MKRGAVVTGIPRADARDLGRTGYETRAQLDADEALKARIEAICLAAGPRMNLGDVRERTVPKMCLIAPPRNGGTISMRSFIPHRCHASIGVLGAVSVASAAALPGTVCDGVAVRTAAGEFERVAVEHPTGEFTVELALARRDGRTEVTGAALLRTARWLFDGVVAIPRSIWIPE